MADRDRERVRSVVRRGIIGEAQEHAHHSRDLLLVRPARAAHRALDLLRRVAAARDPAQARREHHRSARVPHGERGARVLAEVQLLERYGVGLVLAEERADGIVDLRQPPLVRGALSGRDHAAVERDEPSVAARDHPVARAGEARVDSENDHDG